MTLFSIFAVIVVSYLLWKNAKMKKAGDLRAILTKNTAELQQYGLIMGEFKDTTLGWVKKECGPLLELPNETLYGLIQYLVEASGAACVHVRMHKDLHTASHINLLKRLGYPEAQAEGAVAAALTSNQFDSPEYTYQSAGAPAFAAWIQDGKSAAEEHVQKAVESWERSKTLNDELSKIM